MSHRKLPKNSADSTPEQNRTEGETSRRDFLRKSTLLGVSAAAAYALVGTAKDGTFVADAEGLDTANEEFEVASRRRRRWRGDRGIRRPSGRGRTVSGQGGDIQFFDSPDIDFA